MIDYNPHRWLDHFFDLRGSMVPQIIGRVLVCVLWAGCVVWLHGRFPIIAIPSTVHGLVGLALGLLLVFRTNSSYDRFWEGRRQWGNIVNASRNLARASRPHLESSPALYRELVRWTIAFSYASMNHLRGANGFPQIAERLGLVLEPAHYKSNHMPLACALEASEALERGKREGLLTPYTQMVLDGYLQQLVDSIGACERIHRTPLPFAYMLHLRRALVVYCFSLPFALVETFRWETIPAILLVAYIFFGIEEIGVEIEDPFGEDVNDLPLDRFCHAIEETLLQLIPSEAETRS
jgi:ion channel-forming bestrophin family protein